MSDVNLKRLKALDRTRRAQLAAYGIQTVEELLSRAHGSAKANPLAKLLKLSRSGLDAILEEGRTLVSKEFLEELDRPVERHKRGALVPPESDD